MNRCFTRPVVEAKAGGKRGGETRLTTLATKWCAVTANAEVRAQKAAAALLKCVDEAAARTLNRLAGALAVSRAAMRYDARF